MRITNKRQKSETIKRAPTGRKIKINLGQVESKLSGLAQSWSDQLGSALCDAFGEEDGGRLHKLYADAFPAGYTELVNASSAIDDVRLVEQAVVTNGLNLSLIHI